MRCQSIEGLPTICQYLFIHLGGEGTVRAKCLAEEHGIMTPAMAQTCRTTLWSLPTLNKRQPCLLLPHKATKLTAAFQMLTSQ